MGILQASISVIYGVWCFGFCSYFFCFSFFLISPDFSGGEYKCYYIWRLIFFVDFVLFFCFLSVLVFSLFLKISLEGSISVIYGSIASRWKVPQDFLSPNLSDLDSSIYSQAIMPFRWNANLIEKRKNIHLKKKANGNK